MSSLAFLGSADLAANLARLRSLLVPMREQGRVAILPTASAYEGSAQAIEASIAEFNDAGIVAEVCPVLTRADAENATLAAQLSDAPVIYLTDGSAMHVRSTLKDSAVWNALVLALKNGSLLLAAPGSGMALGDPMIDPRGGAFGLGLGLIQSLSLVPGANTWSRDRRQRMLKMVGRDVCLALINNDAALICDASGAWSGVGEVIIVRNGEEHSPSSLNQFLMPT
jgi:cyanophycinase